MGNAQSFRKDMIRAAEKTSTVLVEVGKEITLTLREIVAERTPKLTGRAAGSWNASANAPDYTTQPVTYNDVPGSVEAGRKNLSGAHLGGKLYVANGLHYIADLNNGSSRKAPAGFVEASAQEANGKIPGIVRKVRGRVKI